MQEPLLILVNENDEEIGEMNKLEAHEKGLLHRAISVLVFNSKGEWLLQRRAASKYHSPGLWTNTCCSHPTPGESTTEAAKRRLEEEMGMRTNLEFAFSFLYKADFSNGLIEHELDHAFIGYSDTPPTLNPEEADEYKYVKTKDLLVDLEANPQDYTAWFKILVPKVIECL